MDELEVVSDLIDDSGAKKKKEKKWTYGIFVKTNDRIFEFYAETDQKKQDFLKALVDAQLDEEPDDGVTERTKHFNDPTK